MHDRRAVYLPDRQPRSQALACQLSHGDWKAILEGWWAAWHLQGRPTSAKEQVNLDLI